MNFSNRLKGNITQALLKAILEDSNYHLVPLGIEECIRKLSLLNEGQYLNLKLPPMLRKLPDFFVSDAELTKSWMVEVKYRQEWNEETKVKLGKEIFNQVENWAPLFLMVFLGTAGKGNKSLPSSYMGIARLEMIDREICATNPDGSFYSKWQDMEWKKFSRIQDVFSSLGNKEKCNEQTLRQMRVILPQLRNLGVFK